MKKSEIRKLDQLWAKKIKERAGHKCEYCLEEGEHVWLNACHIFGRRNRTLRWDMENGICLCVAHHRMFDQRMPESEKIRRIVIGEERIERLTKKAPIIAKNQDFKQIKQELEELS